ncbi:MAG: HAMP domain-containing sensor histidine kinase [Acidobacteriota bacterium]
MSSEPQSTALQRKPANQREPVKNSSLRRRGLVALAVLCSLNTFLLIVFGVLTYEAGQESAAQRLLSAEVERFQRALESNPGASPPSSALVQAYEGRERLPPRLRDNLHRFEAEDYDIPLEEWEEIQLWRRPGADGRETFLVLDLGETEDAAILAPNLQRLLGLGLALMVGLGGWGAWWVTQRLTLPLTDLARSVRHYRPGSHAWIDPLASRGAADSEAQELARAFAAADQRLREVLDRERQFTRNASHELRTPITAIKGSHEILRRSVETPSPRAERALATLGQAVSDMETLVETFLWLARAERHPEVEESAATGRWLEQLVDQQRPLLRRRAVRIQLQIQTRTHHQIPFELFRIAAANLVRNALQHTAEGEVIIRLEEEQLEVVDTGPGISQDVLEQLGQAFVQGEHSTGHGLGLAIVRRIAQRCGWRLEIHSDSSQGTRARLLLRPQGSNQRAGGGASIAS